MKELLQDQNITLQNKLRLVILYALRYEKNTAVATQELENDLLRLGLSELEVAVTLFIYFYFIKVSLSEI